ncbi:TIGR02301 family protein [Rhizobium sp. SGZ-381]|uniref:TIGR02301 family protein n=1 Tax=Rhizobium sp. SGZ-381 TaxID=3342800 RepID=UPI0036723F7B
MARLTGNIMILKAFCRPILPSLLLSLALACPASLLPATSIAAPAQKKGAESQPISPPQQPVERPAPYDAQLLRLAEILGSVQYLRTLCASDSDEWRASMQSLLDAETGAEPKRRERLTAAFNRGYRAFAAVHSTCTPAARVAEERYRNEGATLSGEIAARYGN